MELAHVAQLVEHVLGKDEVSGSIPLMGSRGFSGVAPGLGDQDVNRETKADSCKEMVKWLKRNLTELSRT